MPDRLNKKEKGGKQIRTGVVEIGIAILLSIGIIAYNGQITDFFGQYSYIGIFFMSLIAHATVFFPTAPVQISMISIAMNLDPLLFGIFAGVGSAIGELTGYSVGLGSQNILRTEGRVGKWIVKFQAKMMKIHSGLAIFFLSAVPNPFFDFAGILAGIAKMKWQNFVFWCALGRIIRYFAIAHFGLWLLEYIV